MACSCPFLQRNRSRISPTGSPTGWGGTVRAPTGNGCKPETDSKRSRESMWRYFGGLRCVIFVNKYYLKRCNVYTIICYINSVTQALVTTILHSDVLFYAHAAKCNKTLVFILLWMATRYKWCRHYALLALYRRYRDHINRCTYIVPLSILNSGDDHHHCSDYWWRWQGGRRWW